MATVSIAISITNIAPVANNDAVNAVVGTPLSIAVLTNDSSATSTLNPATVVVSNLVKPAGSTVVLPVANANGTVPFTADLPGIYTFQYRVTDSFPGTPLNSNLATVTITVVPANVPPVANPDSAVVVTGGSVLINLTGNDTDSDGTINAASVAIVSAPGNGTLTNNLNGTVTFIPAAGFVGPTSFTYNVKDNQGATSNTVTVSITVNPPTNETLTVTRAQYTLSTRSWRIDGTTTARVNGETISIYNSATVGGTPFATVPVAANGSWTLSKIDPVLNTGRKISFQSSFGKLLENVTVTVR